MGVKSKPDCSRFQRQHGEVKSSLGVSGTVPKGTGCHIRTSNRDNTGLSGQFLMDFQDVNSKCGNIRIMVLRDGFPPLPPPHYYLLKNPTVIRSLGDLSMFFFFKPNTFGIFSSTGRAAIN